MKQNIDTKNNDDLHLHDYIDISGRHEKSTSGNGPFKQPTSILCFIYSVGLLKVWVPRPLFQVSASQYHKKSGGVIINHFSTSAKIIYQTFTMKMLWGR
jgi:hypothetical protein